MEAEDIMRIIITATDPENLKQVSEIASRNGKVLDYLQRQHVIVADKVPNDDLEEIRHTGATVRDEVTVEMETP